MSWTLLWEQMEQEAGRKLGFPPFLQRLIDDAELKGRASVAAHNVLTVLRARRVAVPDAARERILNEKDPAQFERWLERASNAASVAEVFDEEIRAA